jgi:hypothetical protein
VAEAVCLSSDELAVLDLDHEALDAPGDASGPTSFINLVFQQGDDASLTLTILDKLGTRTAAHPGQWTSERD